MAFVVGVEIEAKLGRAMNPGQYEVGWHATSTLGVFGAAAAAARILGLSAERIAHALAIAASMASGIKANFGTDGKPWHAGHAAPMRRRGRTARAGRLHRRIRARSSTGTASARRTARRIRRRGTSSPRRLGAPHEVVEPGIGVKRFPACASTHQALDATLA